MSESRFSLPKVRGSYRFDADLSKTTWFGVGGKAQILFRPKDIEDLSFFLKNKPDDLEVNILGVGSNVIVRDGGIKGVLIKLGAEFAKINHEKDIVTIGAGCLCSNAALYSKIHALGGLEFLTGIPGSIGGAMAMNAGCYDSDISKVLISAIAINLNGEIFELNNKDFGFKYRGNELPEKLFLVEGIFKAQQSSSSEVAKKIAEFNKKREETQPIRSKTGGSTFKNPGNGSKAWELVDKAGCRGMSIGDAQISQKHCNFMINNSKAKACDLIKLGNQVINMVQYRCGVTLEWEIKIIGQDD